MAFNCQTQDFTGSSSPVKDWRNLDRLYISVVALCHYNTAWDVQVTPPGMGKYSNVWWHMILNRMSMRTLFAQNVTVFAQNVTVLAQVQLYLLPIGLYLPQIWMHLLQIGLYLTEYGFICQKYSSICYSCISPHIHLYLTKYFSNDPQVWLFKPKIRNFLASKRAVFALHTAVFASNMTLFP